MEGWGSHATFVPGPRQDRWEPGTSLPIAQLAWCMGGGHRLGARMSSHVVASLYGWHCQVGARAMGRFSCAAWKWKGPQRLSNLIPLPHSVAGWLTCLKLPGEGQGLAHGSGLQMPIPGLLPWLFRDASLAPDGKVLYWEHNSESPEGTKINWKWIGRVGCDSSYSKMCLVFLRQKCHFITLGAWQ